VKTHWIYSAFHKCITWDVPLASDFISENWLEILWISQVISRGTCLRQTRHTTNKYKEQVKSSGTSKNLNLNFHLWKSGHPIELSVWSVTCSSLMQEDMSYGNLFFGTEGYICNPTYSYKQTKNIAKYYHLIAQRRFAYTLVLFLLPQLYNVCLQFFDKSIYYSKCQFEQVRGGRSLPNKTVLTRWYQLRTQMLQMIKELQTN